MKTMSKGFTLIELMIVVAIVAILAMVAMPSYESYVRKGRRVDAHGLLQAAQLAQEKFRLNTPTYAGDFTDSVFDRVCVRVGTECWSQQKHYRLTVTVATATAATDFTLAALAQGAQARDTACATITITQAVTGTPPIQYGPAECWNR
jgi:type IV pilus assembly protein PilE